MYPKNELPDEDKAEQEGSDAAAEVSDNLEKLLDNNALDANEGVFDSDGKVLVAAGRGVGLRFVATYFPEAQRDLRIATGYFKLGGFNLAHRFLDKNTKVHVLVGQAQGREASRAVVGEMVTVLREIMRELGTTRVSLTEAVEELMARIRSGKFIFRSIMVP